MISQRTDYINASAEMPDINDFDQKETVSQRTAGDAHAENSVHAIKSNFNCLEDQRNVRSVNQIIRPGDNFDH